MEDLGNKPSQAAGSVTRSLLLLARRAIECHLSGGDPRAELAQGAGGAPHACFVSLKKDDRLRGCMGTTVPSRPTVEQEVVANSLAAALRDPRFKPVRAEELKVIAISIDLLSPMEKVKSLEELDPALYGLLVRAGSRAGLLLPDLPGVETVERQIEICREKGGIAPGDEITLERFTVERLTE